MAHGPRHLLAQQLGVVAEVAPQRVAEDHDPVRDGIPRGAVAGVEPVRAVAPATIGDHDGHVVVLDEVAQQVGQVVEGVAHELLEVVVVVGVEVEELGLRRLRRDPLARQALGAQDDLLEVLLGLGLAPVGQAQAVGIAQGATDYANAYAKERIAFGKPINELQAIQFKLADMETRTAAARELLYKACAMADRNEPGLGKHSSMAKLFASDTAMWVTVEAIQVLGGYGYVSEYPVERMMRDAKITQIYEGTNEIQRVVIARAMRG